MSLVFLILGLIVLGGMGFLAHQVSELNSLYYASKNFSQSHAVDAKTLLDEIDALKKEVEGQKEMLTEFSSTLTTIGDDLKSDLSKKFIPAPSFVVEKSAYKITATGEGVYTVEGDKAVIEDWKKRNEFFLNEVLRRSLKTDTLTEKQTMAQGGVVIKKIVPRSLFDQMGLKDGDKILTVNDRPMPPTMLRTFLVSPVPAKIALLREGKKIMLNVTYTDNAKDKVTLDISKKQFNETLPHLLTTLKVTPALKDGSILGVKIIDLDTANVFSLMNFKPQDVITEINGESVNNKKLLDLLKAKEEPLAFNFIRDEKSEKVVVEFMP
jgi:C-terminal processing protease CtpA/Prc